MRIAYTIGSYRLLDFIKLSILQIRRLDPDAPILISDDKANESPEIERVAKEHGCVYDVPRERRGHFGNDWQSIVNSIVFADANDCDIAVKASQRFIFRKVSPIDAIKRTFEDPNIMAATPGKPNVIAGTKAQKGFGAFGTLSDVVCIRRGALTPDQLIQLYRERLLREKIPWASFIECVVDEIHTRIFPGKTAKISEITNPDPRDPAFLRRYQATDRQYRDLAGTHGFGGAFNLSEWSSMEQGNYFCRPMVV